MFNVCAETSKWLSRLIVCWPRHAKSRNDKSLPQIGPVNFGTTFGGISFWHKTVPEPEAIFIDASENVHEGSIFLFYLLDKNIVKSARSPESIKLL